MYAGLKRKQCTKCEKVKKADQFYFVSKINHNLRSECKACLYKQNKVYNETDAGIKAVKKSKQNFFKNPAKLKAYKKQQAFTARFRKYGITEEQYNKLFEKQKGNCLICKKHHKKTYLGLVVDHCHSTKEVRGLLCNHCNAGIGFFKDSISNLKETIKYLNKFKK